MDLRTLDVNLRQPLSFAQTNAENDRLAATYRLDLDLRPLTEEARPPNRLAIARERPSTSTTRFPSSQPTAQALAKQVWDHILQGFARNNADSSRLLQNNFRRLLPRENSTEEQVAIWDEVLRNMPAVTSADLGQIIKLSLTTSDDNDRFVPGATYFYVRSWSFTLLEIRGLVERMLQEGYNYRELEDWLLLAKAYHVRGIPTFTIRYVGKVDGPRTPVLRWLEDVNQRTCGIMFVFLRILEIYHPKVAASREVHTIIDAGTDWSQNPWVVDDTERVLIQLFDQRTLLNRQLGGLFANYVPSEADSILFQNLRTDFFDRYHALGHNTTYDITNGVAFHFRDVQQVVQDNPAQFASATRPFSDTYRDVCTAQAIPPFLIHGMTLVLVIGKDVTLASYLDPKKFFDGVNQAGALTCRFLLRLAQTEAQSLGRDVVDNSFKPQFPFLDLWPCLRHKEIAEAIRWLRNYMSVVRPLIAISCGRDVNSITRADFHHSHGLKRGELMSRVAGHVSIQFWDGDRANEDSAFINIPNFDPGFDKYARNPLERRRVLDLSWCMNILVANVAINVLQNHASDDELPTRLSLCEEILYEIESGPDPGIAAFLVEFERAKDDLVQYSMRERQGGRSSLPKDLILNDSGRRELEQFGLASGKPLSTERDAQLEALWQDNIPDLHELIPHDANRKAQWKQTFDRLREGHSYYLAMLSGLPDSARLAEIIAQCPETQKFLGQLQDPAIKERAAFTASRYIIDRIKQDQSIVSRITRSTDWIETTDMQGAFVSVVPFPKNEYNGYVKLQWQRKKSQRYTIQFQTSVWAKPSHSTESMTLSFTTEGIDLCDSTGHALRPSQSVAVANAYKASFPVSQLKAQTQDLRFHLWADVMALSGYTLPEAAVAADARKWSQKKGITFIPPKAQDETPRQNRPRKLQDALYLLEQYIDKTLPEGGWFRTAPKARKPDSEEHLQGFVAFLRSPEYQLHPYSQEWIARLDKARPDIQMLEQNFKVLRACRKVSSTVSVATAATSSTRTNSGGKKRSAQVQETMYDLGPIGSSSAPGSAPLPERLVPGQHIQACIPCFQKRRKCEMDVTNLDLPCARCNELGLECERKTVAVGVKAGGRLQGKKAKAKREADAALEDDESEDKEEVAGKKKRKSQATAPTTKRKRISEGKTDVEETKAVGKGKVSGEAAVAGSKKRKKKTTEVTELGEEDSAEAGGSSGESSSSSSSSDDEVPRRKKQKISATAAKLSSILKDTSRPATRGKGK